MIVKRTSQKIIQELRNLWLALSALVIPSQISVAQSLPYVSQFATLEYAEKILKDQEPATTDPAWQAQGADSAEEYAAWSTTTCGMACLSMILEDQKEKRFPVIALARIALDHGVYLKEADGEFSPLRYGPFCSWVQTFGLAAATYTRLTIPRLQYLLARDDYVIISVNPNIRGYETADPKQVGGHLVLVTGYNKTNGSITIHNPSGFVSLNSQSNHTMPVATFTKHFAGRGIALRSLLS